MNPQVIFETLETASESGFCLIIKGYGKEYTNQSGGLACRHPVCVGTAAPFDLNDEAAKKIDEFTQDRHGGWLTSCTDEDANVFDEILAPYGLRCDRALCHDSMEAWVHVISGQHGPCVLVWGNSD